MGSDTTDQQRVLRRNEAQARLAALDRDRSRYEKPFETIDDGFSVVECTVDENGQVVDWLWLEVNRAFETLSTLRDVVGRRASELLPGFADNAASLGRAIATGETIRTDGDYSPGIDRWFRAHFARVGGEGSRIVAVRFEDITTRKRAEAALRESEARHRLLVESWTQAVWETDAAGVVTVDSPSWRSYTGQTREEWLGYGWLSAVHPDDRAYAERQWREAIAARGLVNAEFRLRAPDGGWRWTNVLAAPVLDAWGEIAKWAGMNIDIDARVRAEKALRKSEERFAQFAASSSDALWIRDATTLAMEYASPAIDTIYGLKPDSILGGVEKWAALIVPDDRETAFRHLELARRGEAVVHEFRIQRPSDGAFRWIRNTDFPLQDDGDIRRIGGIAHDSTEAKLAAEHQALLLAELQHRVRNIMALIRSITARTGEHAQSVAEYSSLVLGRLQAFSRVQALLTRAANISVGVRSIVQDEVGVLAQHEGQYVLDGPNVELSPKAAEVLTLAVHELTTNAVKYGALSTPIGKVTVIWSVFEQDDTPWLSFDWAEEGAPERPQPTSVMPRRRGMGSDLIEGRVPYELKGKGRITIEPGGALCHLEFPLQEGASILETGAPKRTTVFGGALDMTGEPDLGGHHVMVVEDDYYLATDTARALQGAGAEVIGFFASEDDARAGIAAQRPDAVVLDINLGKGATFKLAEHLKDHRIPFVFVTGYDQAVIPKAFDGIERLEKPVQLRQIVGAVAKLLSRAA